MLQRALQHSEKERGIKSTQIRAKELSIAFTSNQQFRPLFYCHK